MDKGNARKQLDLQGRVDETVSECGDLSSVSFSMLMKYNLKFASYMIKVLEYLS